MHELRDFLTHVVAAKRDLKEVYYTTRSKSVKADAKSLVVLAISIQKIVEELLSLWDKNKSTRKMLDDRKAQMTLLGWSKGLPKRVQDYRKMARKLEPEHVVRYHQLVQQYMTKIAEEITKWLEDIKGVGELPRVPRE